MLHESKKRLLRITVCSPHQTTQRRHIENMACVSFAPENIDPKKILTILADSIAAGNSKCEDQCSIDCTSDPTNSTCTACKNRCAEGLARCTTCMRAAGTHQAAQLECAGVPLSSRSSGRSTPATIGIIVGALVVVGGCFALWFAISRKRVTTQVVTPHNRKVKLYEEVSRFRSDRKPR